jgi:hypothetical protein
VIDFVLLSFCNIVNYIAIWSHPAIFLAKHYSPSTTILQHSLQLIRINGDHGLKPTSLQPIYLFMPINLKENIVWSKNWIYQCYKLLGPIYCLAVGHYDIINIRRSSCYKVNCSLMIVWGYPSSDRMSWVPISRKV